jgi:hypothetical protein
VARHRRSTGASNVRLAVAFGVMLSVVVATRLAVVWLAGSSGWARRGVSVALVVVFVGIPAAYGLRGLLRDDGSGGRG